MTEFVPPADRVDATRVFNEHRYLLMAVAYRILGRVTDAEDAVQDAWLRWVNTRPSEVVDPRAFLVRVGLSRTRDYPAGNRPATAREGSPRVLRRPLAAGTLAVRDPGFDFILLSHYVQ